MDSRWLKGKHTADNKAKRKAEVLSYQTAFNELKELLEPKKLTEADYDSPSWAYKQADTNGYNRALTLVLSLLKE